MAKALLAVRAEVPETERARFDHWYETDHLPWALRAFAARRAWRCWSRGDPPVHVAFYEFDSVEAADPFDLDFDGETEFATPQTFLRPCLRSQSR